MRKGFTLVELVIVVLILGILAAIAVPKVFSNSEDARDAAIARTLTSIRDAIDMYRAKYNCRPPGTAGACDLPAALDEFLAGKSFPIGSRDSNAVNYVAGPPTVQPGTFGWVYSFNTAEIIFNSNAAMKSEPTTTYDEL